MRSSSDVAGKDDGTSTTRRRRPRVQEPAQEGQASISDTPSLVELLREGYRLEREQSESSSALVRLLQSSSTMRSEENIPAHDISRPTGERTPSLRSLSDLSVVTGRSLQDSWQEHASWRELNVSLNMLHIDEDFGEEEEGKEDDDGNINDVFDNHEEGSNADVARHEEEDDDETEEGTERWSPRETQ